MPTDEQMFRGPSVWRALGLTRTAHVRGRSVLPYSSVWVGEREGDQKTAINVLLLRVHFLFITALPVILVAVQVLCVKRMDWSPLGLFTEYQRFYPLSQLDLKSPWHRLMK